MITIVIAGGNSGIGLQIAHRLVEQGHRVLLLGRDPAKGAAAVAATRGPGTAEFLAVDLSTHAGVRAAAETVRNRAPRIDTLLHTSGVLLMEDARTPDGLHPFFAVNYLSRYHLTQLLMPQLAASGAGRVLMMTSNVPLTTRIDFDAYPSFSPFQFRRMTAPIQLGNHHYAAHLRDSGAPVQAGVLNAGVARTAIWRATPLWVRMFTTVMGPLFFDSVATSAANGVALATGDRWPGGSWWPKPGRPDRRVEIRLDPDDTRRVVAESLRLTGA